MLVKYIPRILGGVHPAGAKYVQVLPAPKSQWQSRQCNLQGDLDEPREAFLKVLGNKKTRQTYILRAQEPTVTCGSGIPARVDMDIDSVAEKRILPHAVGSKLFELQAVKAARAA